MRILARYSELSAAAILIGVALGAEAQPPNGPPPEALAACKSQSAAAACSFAGRDGNKVNGTCWAPESKPLACRPNETPGRNNGPAHSSAPPNN